jgi:hypothetical protein
MFKFNYKKHIEYIIPPVALDIVRWIRAMVFKPSSTHLIKKNFEWRERHTAKRVFIIANGPSILKLDRSWLVGEKVIVMNSFDRASWKDEVDIVAHCIGDPRSSISWSENEIANNINGTNSQSYWLDSSCWKEIHNISPDKKLHYVFVSTESGIWGTKRFELHKPTMGFQTTAQLAIQVALYMGFRDIGLVGFDHDWLASRDYMRHFYSLNRDETDKLGEFSYHDIIRFMDRMWKIYYRINLVANTHKAQIYNLTPSGFLDVFPRLSIENFVGRMCAKSHDDGNPTASEV